jgi:hypothetical protein
MFVTVGSRANNESRGCSLPATPAFLQNTICQRMKNSTPIHSIEILFAVVVVDGAQPPLFPRRRQT